MADEPNAEVVPLFPLADEGDDANPVRTKGAKRYCRHKKTMLDMEVRSIECRGCGAVLDPYDVLDELARRPERWIAARKEAERKARVAQANLDELLREERNAKARARRRAGA